MTTEIPKIDIAAAQARTAAREALERAEAREKDRMNVMAKKYQRDIAAGLESSFPFLRFDPAFREKLMAVMNARITDSGHMPLTEAAKRIRADMAYAPVPDDLKEAYTLYPTHMLMEDAAAKDYKKCTSPWARVSGRQSLWDKDKNHWCDHVAGLRNGATPER